MDDQKIQGPQKLSNTTHIIRQQVLDIAVPPGERAHELQDELSYLYNRKLIPLIDDIFTSVSGERIIRLDKLEVDLGGVNRENLEQELVLKVKEQLRKALDKAVSVHVPGKVAISGRREVGEIRLLEHYLLYGSYPWWVSSSDRPSVAGILLSAMAAYPAEVVSVLRSTGRKAWVRRRLALRFTEPQLEQVVRLLEPQHAQFIIDYSTDLQQLHEKTPAVKAPAQEFREAKWEFIFTYLLNERGTVFNTRSFVKSTIAQLAAKYNIAYGDLLAFLAVSIKRDDLPFSCRSSLPLVLADIFHEHKEASAVAEVNSIREQGEQLQFPVLSYFLVHGSLPRDAKENSNSDLLKMFYHALAHKPAHTLKIVKEAARRPGAIKRIASAFPDTLIIKLIYVSEPSNASYIIDYSQGLQKLEEKERIVKTPLSEFRKVKWELVLTHLFTERGSYFNMRSFVQDTLRQLAARYNMQYSELLAFLSSAIKITALPAGVHQTLPAIIHSLAEEEADRKEAVTLKLEKKTKEEERGVKQRDALSYFLAYGKLPWWYKEPQYPTAAQLAIQLIRLDAREVVKALEQAAASAPHYIAANYPLKLVYRIITLLEPAQGRDIVTYISSVQRLQQEKALVHPRPAAFMNVITEVTLTYLLADRGSHFNTKSYIRYTLQKLAARFNIVYGDLLQRMGAVIPLLPPSSAGRFTKVIAELDEEEVESTTRENKILDADNSDKEAEDEHAVELAESITRWMQDKHGVSISFESASSDAQELFYFLLNGKWKNGERYNVDDLIVNLMQKEREQLREQVAAFLASSVLRQRLISALPEGRVYELVGMLAPGGFSFLSSYLKDIDIVLSEHSALQGISNRYRTWLHEYTLATAGFTFTSSIRLTEQAFIQGFIKFMAGKEGRSFIQSLLVFETAARKVIPELVTQLPLLISRIKRRLEEEKKKKQLKEREQKEQENLRRKMQNKLKKELERKQEEEKQRKANEEKHSMNEEMEEPGDSIYVSNAGLSLVAPYLQRYFEMLGLVSGGKFLNDRAAARGVHLLQYMATGAEEDESEYELAFNKLLCGLATWWPVEPTGALTDKERETTGQMLNAVLRNWPAMKSTTPETFRESFFQRQGRLLRGEKHWTLSVEKKTFDVLLTNLPWSFSTIKFPWMEKVIYVEWR